MASRATKMTITVVPMRTHQNVTIRATGRIGKVALSIPALYDNGIPLSPANDPKTYWDAVLIIAQAKVLSM